MKAWLAVLAAVAYAAWKLAARFSPQPEFDAQHIYLPFARRLLDDAAAFLATEQSIWVAPFGYAWPALFGADAARLKVANIVLFLVLIVIAYRIGTLLYSRRAGALAALMLAASPTLKNFIPTALTEPPFIFLTGVWIWALAEGCTREYQRGRWWMIAGLAFALALLTRPTYLYFAPAALALGFYAWWSRRTAEPELARGIALSHGIALCIVALVIARNALLFGYPAISTGAGAGLFLGSNPMTGGYDAAYLGLLLDDGAATAGAPHLSIESDRLLRGIATLALADRPFLDVAMMYAHKLGAFLFVTSAETQGLPEILRGWRIALLVLAAYGWWRIRVPQMRWLLGGAFAYQALIHMPVLYSHRYSVSAIDLPLTLMAAVGAAHAVGRFWRLLPVVAVTAACVGAGFYVSRHANPPSPDIDRAPHARFWKAKFDPPLEVRIDQPAMIEVRDAPGLHPWDNSVLDLFASSLGESCRGFSVRYRRKGEEAFVGPLYRRIEADAEPHRYALGTRLPLALYAEGTLRVEADCAPGATLHLHGARIATGRFATYYRQRYLGQPVPADIIDPGRP